MPGMTQTDPATRTRMEAQGFIFDPTAGGFVNRNSVNPATGKPYGAPGGMPSQAQSNPALNQWGSKFNPATQSYTYGVNQQNAGSPLPIGAGGGYGAGGDYGGGGGGGGTRAASPSAAGNTDQITQLINEIRSAQPPQYTAPQIPITTSGGGGTPYDQRAENAAYGAAKERTGMATQSALKALREQLNSRGLGEGSGLEGEMTTGLIRGGLGELASTDRQLAEARANRAFTAGQSDTDRTISQNEFNAGLQDKALSGIPSFNLSKWGLLAQLAGMLY